MGKQKDKEKTINTKSWESYGVSFWIAMAIASGLMAVLGVVTFAFAVLRILYGDFWFMWFVLAVAGAGALALSVFCLDLFPSWAGIVRTIRLSEARMSGAMSISQINRYEEREDRRTNEVKDKVQESYTKVGKDVLTTQKSVAELDSKLETMFNKLQTYRNMDANSSYKNIESSLESMNKKLEAYTKMTNETIQNLQTQMANLQKGGPTPFQETDDSYPAPTVGGSVSQTGRIDNPSLKTLHKEVEKNDKNAEGVQKQKTESSVKFPIEEDEDNIAGSTSMDYADWFNRNLFANQEEEEAAEPPVAEDDEIKWKKSYGPEDIITEDEEIAASESEQKTEKREDIFDPDNDIPFDGNDKTSDSSSNSVSTTVPAASSDANAENTELTESSENTDKIETEPESTTPAMQEIDEDDDIGTIPDTGGTDNEQENSDDLEDEYVEDGDEDNGDDDDSDDYF